MEDIINFFFFSTRLKINGGVRKSALEGHDSVIGVCMTGVRAAAASVTK